MSKDVCSVQWEHYYNSLQHNVKSASNEEGRDVARTDIPETRHGSHRRK